MFSVESAAPWGWLRSAYKCLCLFFAKCPRWFRRQYPRATFAQNKIVVPGTRFLGSVAVTSRMAFGLLYEPVGTLRCTIFDTPPEPTRILARLWRKMGLLVAPSATHRAPPDAYVPPLQQSTPRPAIANTSKAQHNNAKPAVWLGWPCLTKKIN